METQITSFMDALASKAPVPGGGGAAGMAGSLAAALGSMVTNLTVGKKRYAAYEEELQGILAQTESLRRELLGFIDRDAEAFAPLAAAYGIPKDAPERTDILEKALHTAAEVPVLLTETLARLPGLLERLTVIGSKLAVSDVGCAATLCRSAAECAALNVFINTRLMQDTDCAAAFNRRTEQALSGIVRTCCAVYDAVQNKVRG